MYRSAVCVKHGGKTISTVPIVAKVLDFELAHTFALDMSFSLMDGFMRDKYPDSWRQMKKQAIDVMLDHRLNPDDISRTSPPVPDWTHGWDGTAHVLTSTPCVLWSKKRSQVLFPSKKWGAPRFHFLEKRRGI